MPYSVHAGCVREHAPSRVGSLYECEVDDAKAKDLGMDHAWYDFYAQGVSTDREGHVDHETVGATHPAARSSGKETAYRPSVKNCAKCCLQLVGAKFGKFSVIAVQRVIYETELRFL